MKKILIAIFALTLAGCHPNATQPVQPQPTIEKPYLMRQDLSSCQNQPKLIWCQSECKTDGHWAWCHDKQR